MNFSFIIINETLSLLYLNAMTLQKTKNNRILNINREIKIKKIALFTFFT